jgi:hypothetical protein
LHIGSPQAPRSDGEYVDDIERRNAKGGTEQNPAEIPGYITGEKLLDGCGRQKRCAEYAKIDDVRDALSHSFAEPQACPGGLARVLTSETCDQEVESMQFWPLLLR